jgi:polyisoprenoid-binding protein YceI
MTAEAERQTVWLIDPKHTRVEFAATYLMMTTVKGLFTGVSGTVRMDEEDLARSSVVVEIDAASLDTGEERRDTHLRSADFLDVERYPLLTFTSTHVEPVGSDRYRVHGDLTIRDTTREVVLDTHLKGRGRTPDGMDVVAFTAQTEIGRQDFGVQWNQTLESGGVLVGEAVAILLEVQALRQE